MHDDRTEEDPIFHQLHLGGDRNFTYVLGDRTTAECAVVDPGHEPDRLYEFVTERGLAVGHVLITHGHDDHCAGAARLVEITGAALHAGPQDRVPRASALTDRQRIRIGALVIEALHTPGHSPGHFCFLCAGRLLTGDLLFCGKVGGTGPHFPGSSAEAEYESLQRVLKLPAETLVFPGHDYYGGEGSRRHSSLGFESAHNPFLTAGSFAAFCDLKKNWATYKKEHGIR